MKATGEEKLRALLNLLEDDSEWVVTSALKELSAIGPELEQRLLALNPPIPEAQVHLALFLVDDYSHGALDSPAQKTPPTASTAAHTARLYIPGQIVYHKVHKYRGVVVDFDPTCRTDSDWYPAAKPDADTSQPWYYILVHRTYQVTYVSQSKLQLDITGGEVVHPLLKHFFKAFEDGFYVRNEKPWPRSHHG